MASTSTRKLAASNLSVALKATPDFPANVAKAMEALQAKLKAGDLSDNVVEALAARPPTTKDFDKSGRWTHMDALTTYQSGLKKRRRKEDPVYAEMQKYIAHCYEYRGLSGALLAMRKLVDTVNDILWTQATSEQVWTGTQPDLSLLQALSTAAAHDAARVQPDSAYLLGVAELDAVFNPKPTPVKATGKPTKAEAQAYNERALEKRVRKPAPTIW
jgi:hypothetical protein